MVAPVVDEVIEIALLPLFCIVGVATWVMASETTALSPKPDKLEIAFTVVGVLTPNGAVYWVLPVVGSA